MKHTRIVVARYGGPDALQVLVEERPEPKRGEVRVRMLAAGVSMPDIMAREGIHPETPAVPFTPGWDLVGVVDALGDGVSGIRPGQIVAALPISGAYAEFACLPQDEVVAVPPGLDAAEAVSLILNYVTAVGGFLLPGRKRVIPYSIQWLKRLRPALFRQDLLTLLDLLQKRAIKPLVAQRLPLSDARHGQELLASGGVVGKIVLVAAAGSLEPAAA